MRKQKVMGLVDMFLGARGISQGRDYIWSLQGPTLIPTEEGKEKLERVKKTCPGDYKILESTGITIL